jgi:hypothetical protein
MNRSLQALLLVVALVLAGTAVYSVWHKSGQHVKLREGPVSAGPAATASANKRGQISPERTQPRIERVSSPSPASRSSQRIASAPITTGAATRSPQYLLVSARLQCPKADGATAGETQACIGIGRIDAADLREAEAARAALARPQAGGPSRDDLVNVREWRHANVSDLGNGVLAVGPVEVPPADAYDVLAWDRKALVYYYTRKPCPPPGATTGTLDLGLLEPTPFTGVRLTLQGKAESNSIRATLSRVPPADADAASRFLTLAQVIAPDLAESLLVGEPVTLTVDQPNLIAPLPPDEALQVTLISPTEVDGEPVQIPLAEGRIVDAIIPLDTAFPDKAKASIELEGILEIGQTGKPVVGATVEREIGLRKEVFTTDERGAFHVRNLPMDTATPFDVQTTRGATRRPVVPESWHFEFVPPLTTTGSVVQQRWQMPAYSYLVLDLSSPAARDALSLAAPPYPVYVVEHDDGGRWVVAPIDFFDQSPAEVAAAIEEPGRYRMLLAASPVAVWPSNPATISGEGSSASTTLADEATLHDELKITVRDTAQGQPVAGAAVTVNGDYGSLPPVRLITSEAGEVVVRHHGCSTITVWVEKSGYMSTERTLSSGELRGEVDLEISPAPDAPTTEGE